MYKIEKQVVIKNGVSPGNKVPSGAKEVTRPFLKWAGGKRQLLNQLKPLFPEALVSGDISRYCEPFIGGGAVFLEVVANYNIREAFLYDNNLDLVIAYNVIRDSVDDLILELIKLEKKYLKLSAKKRQMMFYEIRESFNDERKNVYKKKATNEKKCARSAKLIFLNKTCFNGLYRVNKAGDFNVPLGRHTNPSILDKENLLNISKTLSIATIECKDFSHVMSMADGNTFVYCDPPYRPLNETSNFTAYSKNAFNDEEQLRLASVCKKACESGALVMISNSDPANTNSHDTFLNEAYKEFYFHKVSALRAINSKGAGRGSVSELVITSYETRV